MVADDPDQCALFLPLLTRAGYAVTTARDGAEALGQLAIASYDLLLTDCYLPGITGDRLIEAVRRAELPTRTVLMSNRIDVNELARKMDADGFVRKEDGRQLPQVVAALLDGDRSAISLST